MIEIIWYCDTMKTFIKYIQWHTYGSVVGRQPALQNLQEVLISHEMYF